MFKYEVRGQPPYFVRHCLHLKNKPKKKVVIYYHKGFVRFKEDKAYLAQYLLPKHEINYY